MKESKIKKSKTLKNDNKQVEKIKRKSKTNNTGRAWFDDANQIEWFPVSPYCD